jgi:GxxExxY protein
MANEESRVRGGSQEDPKSGKESGAQEGRKRGRGEFGDQSEEIIGALIEVHRALGPGLLESAYEACVCRALESRGFAVERKVPVTVTFMGEQIDCAYRMDVLVERRILLELKCVAALLPIHEAQVITYLKLSRVPVGLLVNFNVRYLRDGIRRLVPKIFRPSPLPVKSPSDLPSFLCTPSSSFEEAPPSSGEE